jgi:hypothetical protein
VVQQNVHMQYHERSTWALSRTVFWLHDPRKEYVQQDYSYYWTDWTTGVCNQWVLCERGKRRIAAIDIITQNTVDQMLSEQLLYSYHLHWAQGLTPIDCPRRDVLRWQSLEKCAPSLYSLFTNEARFMSHINTNFHNTHVWSDEIPHAVLQSRHQYHLFINTWARLM